MGGVTLLKRAWHLVPEILFQVDTDSLSFDAGTIFF